MYVAHNHVIADLVEASDQVAQTERHSHSVHQRHAGHWSNPNHEGVDVISWAEHGRRYRKRDTDAQQPRT
jgi:hypothetical protein